MRKQIKIIVLAVFFGVLLIVSLSLLPREQDSFPPAPADSGSGSAVQDDGSGEGPAFPVPEAQLDDANYLPDEQDVFSSKLFQRKLAPLTREERIIWAFRIAEKYTFL